MICDLLKMFDRDHEAWIILYNKIIFEEELIDERCICNWLLSYCCW